MTNRRQSPSKSSKKSQDKILDVPIVTQVEPFKAFYKAEDYHKTTSKRTLNSLTAG